MRLLLLIVAIFSSLYSEMSLEEKRKILQQTLFQETQKKREKDKKIYLPLRINRVVQDEILVKIDNFERVYITNETLQYIASLLKKEYRDKFIIKGDRDNFVPLDSVEQLGIKSQYNNKLILVDISIPVYLKKPSLINLGKKYLGDINNSISPKEYSGGINLYLNQEYNNFEEKNFNCSSEIFLNIKDVVFEGRVNYYDKDNRVQRGRIRAIKDDKKHQLRYQLGDITFPTDRRESHIEAFGFSVEKNLDIGDRYLQRNSNRINSFEFFIKNRSRVDIYINGDYRNSIELDAGTHNLYDLHLSTGINKIKLKIVEDGGKVEFIEFNDFYYSEILQKGFAFYGLGVGIESSRKDGKWVYYNDKRVLSSYIKYGLFDTITIQSGIEMASNYLSNGIDIFWGSDIGLLDSYIVHSRVKENSGYKSGVEYRTNIGVSSISLGYENIQKSYLGFNSNLNRASKLYRANLYTQLYENINLGASASKYIKDNNSENRYELLVRKNFGNFVTELNFEKNENSKRDKEIISINLEYQIGQYSSRYKQYLNEDKEQLNLRYRSEGRYGLDSGIDIKRDTTSTDYSFDTEYNDEKIQVDTTYRINDYRYNKDKRLSIQLATGAVFAGDKSTISRPISSSFVIIENDNRLKNPLGIIGYQKSENLKYNTYTVEIGDYSYRELFVDESKLDFGIDLVSSKKRFKSNYRTGSQMSIDIDNFYSIVGFFYNKKSKKPIKNRAFKIFNTQTGEKRVSFTNKDGKFIINHMEAGIYNISFVHKRGYKGVARYILKIKETKDSLQNVGIIYLDMPKKIDIKYKIVNSPNSM